MNEFIRPKPLCLIVISGLHVNQLFESKTSNIKALINNYPFLILNSDKRNVDNFQDSYIELGSGSSISEDNKITLSKVISDAGLSQLHLADTESYAYNTYFFNNQNKVKHKKEVWLKKSLLKVDSHLEHIDAMHSKITKDLIKEINKQDHDFIVVNYNDLLVNTDKVKTINNLDKNIKDIIDIVLSFNGAVLITSNSSLNSLDNRVPFFLIGKQWQNKSYVDFDFRKKINEQDIGGDITQISPTVLKILGLSKPREMKTNSLI
jgi:2,3-bisphosphoglycerate-independent phosphoglycerate mutase